MPDFKVENGKVFGEVEQSFGLRIDGTKDKQTKEHIWPQYQFTAKVKIDGLSIGQIIELACRPIIVKFQNGKRKALVRAAKGDLNKADALLKEASKDVFKLTMAPLNQRVAKEPMEEAKEAALKMTPEERRKLAEFLAKFDSPKAD